MTAEWKMLVWCATCLAGALAFLKLVADQLTLVEWSLQRREQFARCASTLQQTQKNDAAADRVENAS